jgi:hypothetical protein
VHRFPRHLEEKSLPSICITVKLKVKNVEIKGAVLVIQGKFGIFVLALFHCSNGLCNAFYERNGEVISSSIILGFY